MIGVLIFPDFQLLDAAGPISVFEIAARFAKRAVPIKVMAATPGPVRSSSGAEMLARKFGSARRDHDADHRRRRWRRGGRARQMHDPLRAGGRQTRRPHRQRLLGHLHPCGSGPARWPPRHHALAAHAAIPRDLSESEARAGPDLRSRRPISGARPESPPASISRSRWPEKISATRSCRRLRASSCSTIAAAADSRSSPRCWS